MIEILYYIGYVEQDNNWTANFNRSFIGELQRRKIPHKILPSGSWVKRLDSRDLEKYLEIESSDKDIWFIAWVLNPVINLIKAKKGLKFARIAGLRANPYEPGVIWSKAKNHLHAEKVKFRNYDKIFFNSRWALRLAVETYPELINRFAYSGRPTDFEILNKYKELPKDPRLVVFNQRFAVEKMHIIEIELVNLLKNKGYKVQHLNAQNEELIQRTGVKELLNYAQSVGLEIINPRSKDEYYRLLAKAKYVITTSASDMLPMSMFEAIYLGAIPVAPNWMCFPEFVHTSNLYTPYDFGQILKIIEEGINREHPILLHDKKIVLNRMLKEMGYF